MYCNRPYYDILKSMRVRALEWNQNYYTLEKMETVTSFLQRSFYEQNENKRTVETRRLYPVSDKNGM